jgi:hypothetical protein
LDISLFDKLSLSPPLNIISHQSSLPRLFIPHLKKVVVLYERRLSIGLQPGAQYSFFNVPAHQENFTFDI